MHVPVLAPSPEHIMHAPSSSTAVLHICPVQGAVLCWNKAEVHECFCGGRKKQERCKCQNDQLVSDWGASEAFSSQG